MRTRTTAALLLVLPFMLCLAAFLHAAPLVVQAEGVGKPPATGTPAQKLLMARRAAEVVALRELTKKVRGAAVSSDGKTQWVDGLIRGHRFGEPQELPDGSVRIVARITLDTLGGNYRVLWMQVHQHKARVTQLDAQLSALTAANEKMMAAVAKSHADIAQLNARIAMQQQQAAQQFAAAQAQLAQLMALAAAQQAEIARLKQNAQPSTRPAE